MWEFQEVLNQDLAILLVMAAGALSVVRGAIFNKARGAAASLLEALARKPARMRVPPQQCCQAHSPCCPPGCACCRASRR